MKRGLCILLSWLLILQSTLGVCAQEPRTAAPPPGSQPAQTPATASNAPPSLDEAIKLSSLEIAALAEKFPFDQRAIQAKLQIIKAESKRREEAFKAAAKAAGKEVEAKERELGKLKSTTTDPEVNKERKRIKCEILKIKKEVTDKTFDFLQQQTLADVQMSRLNLLANWRSVHQQLERRIVNGTASQRPYGDVLDIGSRSTKKPFRGQERDVQWGQREIDAARERKMFPQEIGDPVVTEYVNRIANNLARNSDLQIPLKVFVVRQEIRKDGKPVLDKDGQPQQVANAMALPGGFLIVFSGVLLESENESEFAGVVAHEMAHAAARHANRMANKGKLFSVAQLAAFIGLQIFAPGLFYAASYLGYYLKGLLLQAIFDGMGIVFTLNALGVSRDFELEADQLGMQYAWKTGYDPEGFIKLFDHMSLKEGYASHTSFFATHPAFGERILSALKEYEALLAVAPDRKFLNDTSEFQEIKEHLRDKLRRDKKQIQTDSTRPSLGPGELELEDCPEILSPPSAAPSPGLPAQAQKGCPSEPGKSREAIW